MKGTRHFRRTSADLSREKQLEHLETKKPAGGNQLGNKRHASSAANKKLTPDQVLMTHAVRAWERLGDTIETLATNEVLVRYDDLTFELRLQRSSAGGGRAA